jgi:hypothetical protein
MPVHVFDDMSSSLFVSLCSKNFSPPRSIQPPPDWGALRQFPAQTKWTSILPAIQP